MEGVGSYRFPGLLIALASERAAVVILDDRQARRVEGNMGLRVLGTLGCLLKAKVEGVLPAVGPIIDKLETKNNSLASRLLPHVSPAIIGA